MEAANATTFDQIYVDRLRAAHGKIFPAIATIRASTRNDSVRQLAQQANQFVMTHMTLLESSGIVDYGATSHGSRPGGGPEKGRCRWTGRCSRPRRATAAFRASTPP